MKKIFTMILLSFFYCDSSFSESYYSKDCKISNAVTANYTINFEKNIKFFSCINSFVKEFMELILLFFLEKLITVIIASKYYKIFL